MWVHGGGLVLGSPRLDDRRCALLCAALGITVVSAAYRTAPQHPYPAALDDCAAAWTWLQTHSVDLGIDPHRVVLAGASAGGGLAAALAQRLRDEGACPPRGQLLVYPMLDDRTAADTSGDAQGHIVWTNLSNRTGWTAYLGHAPGGPTAPPYAVPARCDDLAGLPPAWIGVGTADLFAAECGEYARRLRVSDVPVELDVVEDAPHGFDALPAPRTSQDFWTAQLGWLTSTLELPPFEPAAVHDLAGPERIDAAPVRAAEEVLIDATPEAVWRHVVDHQCWPDWFGGLSSVVVTGRADGVGGRRRVTAGPARFDEVFTVWEPARHFAFAVTASSVPGLDWLAESITLEPTGSTTLVRYRQGLAARRGYGWLWSALWARAAAQLAPSLRALKARVETHGVG
jgi:acetyl esterase/lipase/uncharacterized protein YndB with AHSA1/START domain